MNPKISVIIPVYNAEKYLAAAIDSVLYGSFSDFEIIAVNDGSADSSLSVLRSYAERDTRVRVIDKPNTGVSDTRNTAIAAAKGEYLAFLDSDDVYAPEYLERMYGAVTESGADVAVCGYVTFRGDAPTFEYGKESGVRYTNTGELLSSGLMTPMCVKLFKKSLSLDNSIDFNTETKYSEDLFYSWKIVLVANKICIINDKLYGYRLTGSGATSKYHPNLYDTYKNAFSDIKKFAVIHDKKTEVTNINLSFAKGLPAFLLMIARKKCSLREKISDIRIILSDPEIMSVLTTNVDFIANNPQERKLYLNARKQRVFKLLWHGYYIDLRSWLAKIIKH